MIEKLALGIAAFALFNTIGMGICLYMVVKSHAEKIGLLSHVAGHYLNAMEQAETKRKLVSAPRTVSTKKVTNDAFLNRSQR